MFFPATSQIDRRDLPPSPDPRTGSDAGSGGGRVAQVSVGDAFAGPGYFGGFGLRSVKVGQDYLGTEQNLSKFDKYLC